MNGTPAVMAVGDDWIASGSSQHGGAAGRLAQAATKTTSSPLLSSLPQIPALVGRPLT